MEQVKSDMADSMQNLQDKDKQLGLLAQEKETMYYRNILLVVLCLALVFFIYRQRLINKTKQNFLETQSELQELKEAQLKNEMAFKNRDLTDFALQINERNTLLTSLLKRIKKIKDKAESKELKDEIQELQLFARNQIEINKEKVELNSHIDETQLSFMYNLIQKYPTLTSKQQKVATYLRLNMPSKEISIQMGIAGQSVNNYRRSIRKKLGLKKDDNLLRALKKI